MRTVLLASAAACGFAAGAALAQSHLRTAAKAMFQPLPTTPPAVTGVETTPARVELGKMLYFEPRLSESHAISCKSCHIVGMGGVDLEKTPIGHRRQRGGRNAPTALTCGH